MTNVQNLHPKKTTFKSLKHTTKGCFPEFVEKVPWNLPLSLTEKTRITLRAARNAAFSFFSFTGSVDQTP